MYQALYRKYRPQTFDEVVGQAGVTQTLKAQLQTGRLSPCLPVHRLPGYRKDQLCQNSGQGGELPESPGWQSLQCLHGLPEH